MLPRSNSNWTATVKTQEWNQRILALVGTDHHPFNRMVELLDALQQMGEQSGARTHCLVQYGTSQPPKYASGVEYLAKSDVQAQIDLADLVICHGGPSTIVEILRSGKRPLVMPRDPRQGEHVDEHQQRFARYMEKNGLVDLIETAQDVQIILENSMSVSPVRSGGYVALPSPDVSALRLSAIVDSLIADRKSRSSWMRGSSRSKM